MWTSQYKRFDKGIRRKISKRCKKVGKGHREIPCQAGFEQSNPLLVRPIPQYFHKNRTRSTDLKGSLHSGSCLVVDQFGFNDFSSAVPDAVRAAHPFHPASCFECFGDTFGCRHLFGKLSEHLVGGMVNLMQMRVQLNGQEQILIQAAFVLTKIAPMAQIGDVRKIPCREIFSAGDSCLYGPCALILNCFVISAVHWIRSFSLGLAECDICRAG